MLVEVPMRTVELPAGIVEYDEVGAGPPVVLLHGLLMDHTVWDRVLPLLPPGHRYLRPVLPVGGHVFLTAPGLDQRVARQVILPCEAFDNFPPGLPGRLVLLAVRMPGGL